MVEQLENAQRITRRLITKVRPGIDFDIFLFIGNVIANIKESREVT